MIYQFILTYSGSTTLTINPAGWNETGKAYIRNDFYNSVLRSYSVKLRFARKSGGGGEIIKTAYDTDGLSADVTCQIKKLNPQTGAYDNFFTGVIDFNPDSLTIERDFVETRIIDGSKEMKFITRDEINYNLDETTSSDGTSITAFTSSPLSVNLPPIDIYLEAKSTGDLDGTDGPTGSLSGSFLYNGVESINNVGARVKLDDGTLRIYENTSSSSILVNVDYIADWDIDLLFKYTAGPPNKGTFTVDVVLIAKNSGGTPISTKNILNISAKRTDISSDVTLNYTGNDTDGISPTVPAGGYIELSMAYTFTAEPLGMQGQITSDFNFTKLDIIEQYNSTEPESPAKCYFPHEIFTRLIQLMTSETTTSKLFYSPELGRTDSEFTTYGSDGDYSLFALTNGRAIRQFPSEPINISMRDAFGMMAAIAPLGLGYDRTNDRFYIDTIDQFYKNSSMFTLSDVKEMTIKPYSEGYHSAILGGYKNKVQYEEAQGAYEFNVPTEFANLIPVKDKLDIQNPVNGDSVGIELARRQPYIDTGSEDTRYDDNNYIVSSQRDTPSGFIAIQGSDYTSVSGFTGIDDYYNIDISPKRNLLRWGSVLTAALWKKLTSTIQFVKSQKGVNITTQLAAETPVEETADVAVSGLDNPLFYPEIYEFLAPINSTIIAALDSDPHRYITFVFDGVTYYGYLLSVEGSDYDKDARWKLLRANTTR